ncbi:XdhC family protein [Sphingobium sp. CR28]|uniref:XdhC family protein n=1 Tax=Sphingobium sp. CR28 TaxID=3400272 RepID=UPI003FED7EFC
MRGLATSPEDILHFLLRCSAEGQETVLVTLVGIEGASPRAIGAQMAIAASGDYLGSFSGGCIEAAVVAEALDALTEGRLRTVRFGTGSPYLDIRLPCGGGIDLLFVPRPDSACIARTIEKLDARRPAALSFGDTGIAQHEAFVATGWSGENFVLAYTPRLRIVAIGQGEELTAVARFAHAFGADALALSPARRDIALLHAQDIAAELLPSRGALPALRSDPWTAIIFLFHDRDWEESLIPWALALPSFYIGALGSKRSHSVRTEMLLSKDVSQDAVSALRSPVGLIPSTRDPATLAASILAEVVQCYATDAALGLSVYQEKYEAGSA